MNLDKPISEIFVDEGYVTQEELVQILSSRSDTTENVGDLLVRLGKITAKQNLKCLGLQMGVPFVDLARMEIDPGAARTVSHSLAIRLLSLPIERTEVAATVAMVNPLDLSALDELAIATRLDIDPVLATEEDVRDAIFRAFGAYDDLGELVGEAVRGVDTEGLKLGTVDEEEAHVNVVELKEIAEDAPVVKLAHAIMARAISMRASDIHIESMHHRVRVRLRIDGLLQEVMSIPKDLQHPLVSRIKVLASLDIAERRVPQDGRFALVSPQGEFDFRVSTYPSVHGEKVVIRILDKTAVTMDMSKLGMGADLIARLEKRMGEPQGMVVVNGPTGSGKTTTLYAGVHRLNAVYKNIVSIEDPVEYQIDGIVQANVNPRAGVTFAAGLRAILRQDPDVILLGEIRDEETARIAIEASLTGHLVMTSIHANDSVGALTRLADMGIEPFLLSSSVSCSVAQRLVRVNCPKCSEEYSPAPEALESLRLPLDGVYYAGRGCEYCAKTGFRGRTGIYEILEVDRDLRRLLMAGAGQVEIRIAAEASGMASLRDDACRKVAEGLTSVEEVLRVTAEA